jgi:hypothetical protein
MKINFLDKRGEGSTFLAVKVIKILIAVICLIGLIALVVNIWYASSVDTNFKEAEASLNNKIYPEIQRVNSGESGNPEGLQIPSPSSWYIIGFTEDVKPNSCVGQKCICICDVYFLDSIKSQAKKCDNGGVCKIVPELISFEKIKIERNGIFISIKQTEDGIGVMQWT